MPRINLLPWREQERKVRRREFMVAAGGAIIASVVLIGVGKLLYAGWTDAQIEKNNILKKEIVKLDAQIADIQDLETRKQRLVARMEIIEKLQRKRPEIVHLFDEIVRNGSRRCLPDPDQADRQQARDPRRGPVEHARVHFHAQYRFVGMDG
jgi:type IV pilus assembly protein PilN